MDAGGQARQAAAGQAILVINDSPEFLELMREFLQDEGYTPHTHAHADGALERVHEVAPALIVLDLVLGEIDGWVVLAQLRADDAARDLPIILCSAAADRTRRHQDALSEAGVRVVEKPFDLDHMVALIIELIGPPSASQSSDVGAVAASAEPAPRSTGAL